MKKNDADLIIEAIDDKLKVVSEALGSIKVNTDTIPEIHERLANVEEKLSVIEKTAKATNLDLNQLDGRVVVLEEA